MSAMRRSRDCVQHHASVAALMSLKSVAQRGCGSERPEHEASQGQRAKDRERAPKLIGPAIGGVRGRNAENQHRHGERQHQQRQQQTAAAQPTENAAPISADAG